jgi:hypothetical protein
MAFDGRPDPNKGYEEKSPCTVYVMQFKNALALPVIKSYDIFNRIIIELNLSSISSSFNNSKIA